MSIKLKKKVSREFLKKDFPENIVPTKELSRKDRRLLQEKKWVLRISKRRIRKVEAFLRQKVKPTLPDVTVPLCETVLFKNADLQNRSKERSGKDEQIQETERANKNWSSKIEVSSDTRRVPFFLFSSDQVQDELIQKERYARPLTEYQLKIKEKRKFSILYGNISRKFFQKAYRQTLLIRGKRYQNLLFQFETRLDTILYRLCFAKTIAMARQYINHKFVSVNGVSIDISSYQVKAGDLISLDNKRKKQIAAQLITICNERRENRRFRFFLSPVSLCETLLPLRKRLYNKGCRTLRKGWFRFPKGTGRISEFDNPKKSNGTFGRRASQIQTNSTPKGHSSHSGELNGVQPKGHSWILGQNLFKIVRDAQVDLSHRRVGKGLSNSVRGSLPGLYQRSRWRPRLTRNVPLVELRSTHQSETTERVTERLLSVSQSETIGGGKLRLPKSLPRKKQLLFLHGVSRIEYLLSLVQKSTFHLCDWQKSRLSEESTTQVQLISQRETGLNRDKKKEPSQTFFLHKKRIRRFLFLAIKRLLIRKPPRFSFFAGLRVSPLKPLHSEVSHRILAAVILYPPQKLAYPTLLQLDLLLRSIGKD